jgi:hypothetical protein
VEIDLRECLMFTSIIKCNCKYLKVILFYNSAVSTKIWQWYSSEGFRESFRGSLSHAHETMYLFSLKSINLWLVNYFQRTYRCTKMHSLIHLGSFQFKYFILFYLPSGIIKWVFFCAFACKRYDLSHSLLIFLLIIF